MSHIQEQGTGGPGAMDVSPEGPLVQRALNVLSRAERALTGKIKETRAVDAAYETLRHILLQHKENEGREVMVPLGPLAFMPGKLVRTHEVMTHLGDDWYVANTPADAVKTTEGRREDIALLLTELEKQLREIRDRKDILTRTDGIPEEKRYNEEGLEIVEIREEYHSDEEEEPEALLADTSVTLPVQETPLPPTHQDVPQLTDEDRAFLAQMEAMERELADQEEEDTDWDGEDYDGYEFEEGYGDTEREEVREREASLEASGEKRVHFAQVISGMQDSGEGSDPALAPHSPPAPSAQSPPSAMKKRSPLSREVQLPEEEDGIDGEEKAKETIADPSQGSNRPILPGIVLEGVVEKAPLEDGMEEVVRLEEGLHMREIEQQYAIQRQKHLLARGAMQKSVLEYGEGREGEAASSIIVGSVEAEEAANLKAIELNLARMMQKSQQAEEERERQEEEEEEEADMVTWEENVFRNRVSAIPSVVSASSAPAPPAVGRGKGDGPTIPSMGTENTQGIPPRHDHEEGEPEEEVRPKRVSRFKAARNAGANV